MYIVCSIVDNNDTPICHSFMLLFRANSKAVFVISTSSLYSAQKTLRRS